MSQSQEGTRRRGDPLADSPPPHPSEAASYRLLDKFLRAKGPVHTTDVPWPLDPAVVLAWLSDKAQKRLLNPSQASRVPLIVETYLLEPFASVALKCFVRKERTTDDVEVSASLLQAVGRVGGNAQVKTAVDYYEYLVGIEHGQEVLPTLVLVRNALGPVATSDSLRAALERRSQELLASNDYASEVEGRELDELAANTLQDIDFADEARNRVNAAGSPPKRIAELLEIYFERTDDGGLEFLLPWVVLEIRKHAHQAGATSVIDALKIELEQARPMREDDGEAAFATVRALRGLLYFDVELTKDDEPFLKQHAEEQMDPLSKDNLVPESHAAGETP